MKEARFKTVIVFFVMSMCCVYSIKAQTNTTKRVVKEYAVSEALLQSYVGKYVFENGMKINITLQDGNLFGKQIGNSKAPILMLAMSKRSFILKALEAQVTFRQNEIRQTVQLVFHKQGLEMIGTKL